MSGKDYVINKYKKMVYFIKYKFNTISCDGRRYPHEQPLGPEFSN